MSKEIYKYETIQKVLFLQNCCLIKLMKQIIMKYLGTAQAIFNYVLLYNNLISIFLKLSLCMVLR